MSQIVETANPKEPEREAALHILFVDDDPSLRRLVPIVLIRQGWKFEVAGDGIEALEKIRNSERRFDVVVTDMQMPRMDGLELAKSDGLKGLPVILMSAKVDRAIHNQNWCKEHGFVAAVEKEVEFKGLKEGLERVQNENLQKV